MLRVVVPSLLVAMLLAGCSGPDSPEATLRRQVQAIWESDADALLSTYSRSGYWDLGGCRHFPRDELETAIRGWLGSAEHREEMAQHSGPEGLYKLDSVETGRAGDSEFYMKCNDQTGIRRDDVIVHVLPAPGAPQPDGWGGVYREERGRWVMVAGD